MTNHDPKQNGKISVVVNTLNEERNLPYCLRSVVAWATDIVVVDMHSTDGTRDVAERYGARVFLHEPVGFVEPARAYAVAQAENDWVLVLDADELVQPQLQAELQRIALANEADIVNIPRRNYLFGAPLGHTGWGAFADRQPRFFKRTALSLASEIHRFMRPQPGARETTLADRSEWHLIHFNYVSIQQFLEKLNRYTSVEASQAIERAQTFTPARALGVAFKEWYRRFVTHKGYRDGWRGLYLSLLMAFYRIAVAAKVTERVEVGSCADIESIYRSVAESILDGYGEQAAERGRH